MLEKSVFYLQKGVFSTTRLFSFVGAGLLMALVLLTVAEVVLRRFFNSPLPGSLEVSEIIIGIVVFLTLAYCAVKGGHIAVDIVVSKFPRRLQASIVAIMHFISTVMYGLLSWQLVLYSMKLLRMGSDSTILEIPIYPFAIIGALGCALLTLALLLDFMSTLVEVRKR